MSESRNRVRYRVQVAQVNRKLLAGFEDFLERFEQVTSQAKYHFGRRDFHAIQADTRYRLNFYKQSCRKIAALVKREIESIKDDNDFWTELKEDYENQISQHYAYEIALTWYNSVQRKVFENRVDLARLFTRPSKHFPEFSQQLFKRYQISSSDQTGQKNQSLSDLVRQILIELPLHAEFEDLERDTRLICERIEKIFLPLYKEDPDEQKNTRFEILHSIFYRNKGAYVVGRVYVAGKYLPFVLPLLWNRGKHKHGVYVDALIHHQNDVSIIFSFTRSYFLVECPVPSLMVDFIQSLIPEKSIGEIYNSIGFNKHGKTELYNSFAKHLRESGDLFQIAPGIKGMVMAVFTLPSYPVVFKLIRDKFEPPKNIKHEEVREKYRLVSRHDRVGRMADTHEFVDLEFPRNRFSDELIEELKLKSPSQLIFEEDKIIIKHLYTERRMEPLNLYLENADPAQAEHAVNEYGKAIKQLASVNIFPGDMLLKNFGVTRHGRVIFYDYDEISFLTDCNFRRIPQAKNEYDEWSGDNWYASGPADIFPEEFPRFLIGKKDIRKLFQRLHGDLFDPVYWKGIQEQIRAGEILTVFPYPRKQRFHP